MQEIKLWSITDEEVNSIRKEQLDYENRLERWIIHDITILSNSLAIIGTQVFTEFNKKIDILAINSAGELVIIELKKDKTYREVIAQVLDYATYVKNLDYNEINTILGNYGGNKYSDIGELVSEEFNVDPDDIEFNSDHKMLIVGSEIDDSTVRIIDYLSDEPYSININAVNFNYFKDENGNEFLAQAFIKPEENITKESKSKNRKRSPSIMKTLFEQEKLKIGDRIYLKPAIEQGIQKDNVSAEIINRTTSCLKKENDNQHYSISSLRKKFVEEYDLKNIKENWGFSLRTDWMTEDEKTLSELLDE